MAHDEAAAESLVSAGLKVLGLSEHDLGGLRKLDVRKQVLAWWVRKQTVVGNRWLARRLEMGDEGNISKVIQAVSRSRDPAVRKAKALLMEEAKTPKSGD